jgi:hypothetical protein
MAITARTNQQTTTGTATQLYGDDNNRVFVSIKNTSVTAGNIVQITGSTGVTGNAHTLGPGDHVEIPSPAAAAAVYILDAGSTHVVCSYVEFVQV